MRPKLRPILLLDLISAQQNEAENELEEENELVKQLVAGLEFT